MAPTGSVTYEKHGIPGLCMSLMSPYTASGVFPDTRALGSAGALTRGVIFTMGFWSNNLFSTLNPPNTPMCVVSNDSWGVFPPASYHSNGVNIGLFDGSGRFITNTINCGELGEPAVRDGASPYGVWGALGSPDGGESVSL
jgi:prepilin-type processing-associated H-X9-DG protein